MMPQYLVRVQTFIEEYSDTIPLPKSDMNMNMTKEQKLDLLTQWLENDPVFFFDQVGPHLPKDLQAVFTLDQDKGNSNASGSHSNSKQAEAIAQQQRKLYHHREAARIHNRRYNYLIHHLRASGYFSEDTIQLRAPSLHEEYIGQYIPDEEKYAPFSDDVTLVERVYHGMDRRYVQEQWQRKKRSEEEQYEEQDDDDEEEEEGEKEKEEDQLDDIRREQRKQDHIPLAERSVNHLEGLRQQKKEELIRLLEEQWMNGLDDQFDYSVVDNDETYDDLVQLNQDMQDQYFDDESVEEENGISNGTGILDY